MPPKSKTMQLKFPALGVVRRQAIERSYSAANYSSPYAVNCRLEDPLANRLRGGSFTGTSRVTLRSGAGVEERGEDDIILRTGVFHTETKDDPVYRDRALTFSDNAITATRVGDHTDTALSADVSDMFRPALFQLSEAYTDNDSDVVGGDVVALVPHKDKYLVCFTEDETWVLSGDPLSGTLRRISSEVGIIAEDAWCKREDTLYFLSSRGLYSVSMDGSGLKAISEDKIPEDLIDVEDASCELAYNHADRGVYIHLTSGVSWFYDTERDQFWPFTDSTSDSHVLIGPIRLGNVNAYGLAVRLYGVLADGSADVDWRIVKGETAEDAAADGKTAIEAAVAGNDYDDYVAAEGTWSAGRSYMFYPRVRAAWCCLWLASEGRWAYENIVLTTLVAGKWR